MTIYRFKIFNNIGNIYNIGKMAAPKSEVEEFCKKQIQEAKRNSNAIYQYEIDEIEQKRTIKQINN